MNSSKKSIQKLGSRIVATGLYLPEKILTNAELEKIVETTDEWIVTRTGIRERRIAAEDETTSDMAAKAAAFALQRAKLDPEKVDLIITATVTPDTFFPSTACYVQHKIGAKNAAAFDLAAACSGFLYGLVMADNLIRAGTYKNILVIGAEKLSSIVDWKDRNTCVLFGDGAGAALVQATPDCGGILAQQIGANGALNELLFLKNSHMSGKFAQTLPHLPINNINMLGKEIFKQAVNAMANAAESVLEKAGCTIEDLRCVITHQANIRIIECLADKLKVPKEKCFVNIHKYGNISAACIPIALREAEDFYSFKRGDKILLLAFGGGLTWAATLLEW